MSAMTSPVVILVNPQMGENIGAVARAMSNFGLSELYLVAPRDGWPNPKATSTAANAEHLLRSAKVFPDLATAMQGVHLAYATTGRPRDMEKRVIEPQPAAQEMAGHIRQGVRCAIVFGPERTGLTNEDTGLCDTIISIPTAPEYRSLNIAQSAVIVGYEWLRASGLEEVGQPRELPLPAPREEFVGLCEQLEGYLDTSKYFRVDDKKAVMWQNLQNMLLRAQWSSQEVQTLRGVLRCLWERRRG